jgi:hypothetical protein
MRTTFCGRSPQCGGPSSSSSQPPIFCSQTTKDANSASVSWLRKAGGDSPYLFLVLIYWAANNWHTARLGLDVAVGDRRLDRACKWLFWPPRLLGVCAHLFAAINLSLAAANQPEFAASGLWLGLVPWSAPFVIVLAAAVVWTDDHFLLSERTGHEGTMLRKIGAVMVASVLLGVIAIVFLTVPGAPAGFSWGTISISASAIVFLIAISWWHKKPLEPNAPDKNGPRQNPENRFFTAGLFVMAFAFACATWMITPVVVGRFCGSMVVAYFAFGAILALVNAFELVVSRATKKWFANKVGAGVVGAYAVAFLIGLAVLNTWPHPFHRVRLCDGGDCVAATSPDEWPTVAAAARAWYEQAKAAYGNAHGEGPVPMHIVATAGGGIRAAYWEKGAVGYLSSALASVIRQARSWTVTASSRDEASDFSWRWPHRTRRHRLHKTMAHLEAAVDLTQADWTGTTQLKNPGLLRRFFEGLPPGGNARHKGIAPLALQNRFAGGILRIDGDKGLRDLFDQRRIHVAVRRETAVAIARTGPYDPEALWGQSPLCLQGLDSPPTHSTGIVLVPADPLHDIALI